MHLIIGHRRYVAAISDRRRPEENNINLTLLNVICDKQLDLL